MCSPQTGQTLTFDGFDSGSTFGDLMARIEQAQGIPIAQQRLIYSGRQRSADTMMSYQGHGGRFGAVLEGGTAVCVCVCVQRDSDPGVTDRGYV